MPSNSGIITLASACGISIPKPAAIGAIKKFTHQTQYRCTRNPSSSTGTVPLSIELQYFDLLKCDLLSMFLNVVAIMVASSHPRLG